MAEPSAYELESWRNLQRHKGRPLSRSLRNISEGVVTTAESLGRRATEYLEERPAAQSVVGRGKEAVAKSVRAVGGAASRVREKVPTEVGDWTGTALHSVRRTASKVSRAGLSPQRVVAKHKKRGHAVETLSDLRRLDLEQVHAVRGQGISWGYPAGAAVSGAGTGFIISGGEIVTAVSAGAAAAPSTGVVLGALAADATAVLALASRAVGHVSLLYGYDPEEPAEKLFVLSVVNAGTAVSASAKTAAMADISRLTQALIRGKSWEVLNQTIVSKVSSQFAKAFGVRLTKKSLGKVVPVVGIVIGGALNWATLESIVDAAELAYRRRFLLEKYPQLADEDLPLDLTVEGADEADETISVLDEIADAGGPDLRQEETDGER